MRKLTFGGTRLSGGQNTLSFNIKPFTDQPANLVDLGIAPFPLEGFVENILAADPPTQWAATNANRKTYLDLAEPIVRMAAKWVNEAGAVIDPIIQKEWNQTSSRYASSVAILMHFGRCKDLLETTCRVMSYCCRRMANGQAKGMSSDFWTRELLTAYICLEDIAPLSLQEQWKADLSQFIPENVYEKIDVRHGEYLRGIHNWAVYSSGGEGLRQLVGFLPKEENVLAGREFFDVYMEHQMWRMTEYGMYRDPNDPITYDITTRLQFALPLAFGMESHLKTALVELLRRSGLAGLLFVSPDGYVPYGGRSSQFNFQEGMLAAICEMEARRYAKSNPKLAGAFKRQAHVSALSTQRWLLDMDPIRHIKNGFDPATSHGIDNYGQYSVYSLLASSFFGLAALLADENISEAPTVHEMHGYVFELPKDASTNAFHKVFASAAGTYIELDTSADHHYDATGLGRVLFSGTPLEMILSMPFSAAPNYVLADGETSASATTIGPVWTNAQGQEIFLADLGSDLKRKVNIIKTSSQRAEFSVHYSQTKSKTNILEIYMLEKDNFSITSSVDIDGTSPQVMGFRVPILESNGQHSSTIKLSGNRLDGEYLGYKWLVTWGGQDCSASWESQTVSNRNGRYRVLRILQKQGGKVNVDIRILR